ASAAPPPEPTLAVPRGSRFSGFAAVLRYAGRRCLLAIPTLLLLSALTFFLGLLAPSDPVTIMLGQHANEAERVRLRHDFGLDRPPLRQYGDFLWHALHGDLGRSFTTRAPVTEMIGR